jgi:hypothetical protein
LCHDHPITIAWGFSDLSHHDVGSLTRGPIYQRCHDHPITMARGFSDLSHHDVGSLTREPIC